MRRAILWVLVAFGLAAAPGGGTASAPGRGVILLVGDGMGVATVTAARIHQGALEGLPRPGAARLAMDEAPRAALVHTWSEDAMVTDSAAAISALMTGFKVPNHVLCARENEAGGIDTLRTVLEIAAARGMATGIVTTTTLTHATPAGCYAHTLDRGDEAGIALALVPGSGNPALGAGVDVLLGGGSRWFLPGHHGSEGRRTDGRDLLREMEGAGYRVVRDAGGLDGAVADRADKVLGVFASSHMAFEADRERDAPGQPSLAAMTRAAVTLLSRNPRGFFLLVEGGKIDHALHDDNAYRAVTDALAFDRAVAAVRETAPEGSLILVTADHDHTLVIQGEASSASDVFALGGTDADGVPYTALVFGNGPTAKKAPPKGLDAAAVRDPDFRERAGIPLDYETHGGMDVPLFAFGPQDLLARIPGSLDNTEVFGILRDAVEGR